MSLEFKVLKELGYGPKTEKQLQQRLRIEQKHLGKVLIQLKKEEKVQSIKGVYILHKDMSKGIPCKLVKLGKNFGFATALDESGDIFIPGRSLLGAMPGDLITVGLFANPRVEGSREGEVLQIDEENNHLVGTVKMVGKHWVLVPDNARDTEIFIKTKALNNAKEGDKVAAEIIERGYRHSDHAVGVTMCFGSADTAKNCATAILYSSDITLGFPDDVKQEAEQIKNQAISDEERSARVDLTDLPIFTIDSASTKDIDDAIHTLKTPTGYELGIHIADVSHYVKKDTAIDKEAFERATSVYYANSVVPMLPTELSNGICSLNPQEERLAFSCIMDLDEQGNVIEYRFVKTIICSKVKGVYSEINEILAQTAGEDLNKKYELVYDNIFILQTVYKKLAILREKRGSMNIESDESKIVLDKDDHCIDIIKVERGESEKMIEEFMLLANSCAANFAKQIDVPFVYRVHEKPELTHIERLQSVLTAAGVYFHFEGPVPTQLELSKILDETRATPLERAVHTGILRSMAKAKYEADPKGHYGLSLEDYAHFTSPIRRYPDLAIHRILSEMITHVPANDLREKYMGFAKSVSKQSSEKEVVAMHAERNIDDCYKAEYMQQYLGEVFEGVIASVVPFGIYVELPNSVEGLVRAAELSKTRMEYVDGVSLTDPLTGESYGIGDDVKVKVVSIDVAHGNVDFVIAQPIT